MIFWSSFTANISNSFFCSSFETGRIVPEVCCIIKAAIKKCAFLYRIEQSCCFGRNLHLLVFLLQFKCTVETTAGNSVTKMMIESAFLPSVWRKLVSASVAKKPSLKLLFQHCLDISICTVQNATEKRICPM